MKNKSFLFLVILILNFSPSAQLFAQQRPWEQHFDINIVRSEVKDGLVYGSIWLNGEFIGNAYENDALKIPTGKYQAYMRYHSQKNFVQGPDGVMTNEGDFLLEVGNVPGRSNILFHSGTKPHHSKGCILLGPAYKNPEGSRYIKEDHPLYILRQKYYGTNNPDSCPAVAITITVQ